MAEETQKTGECAECKKQVPLSQLSLGPHPHDDDIHNDINGDVTEVWMCDACRESPSNDR